MSVVLTDRDFGDEDDSDWDAFDDSFWDDPEEFIVDDEAWEELARSIAEEEDEV